jgi:Raf kinase inhibitor-like YbhB/YbcL family protein
MLEKMPHLMGQALSAVKAGIGRTVYHSTFAKVPATIAVSSDAFTDGGRIPSQYTDDGGGLSPPLAWTNLPAETGSIVLLVEDPDAPMPRPFVHLIAWNEGPCAAALPEGDFHSRGSKGARHDLGRNSFQRDAWLPPDPPRGHGPHRYMFEIYALDGPLHLPASPGRGDIVDAMSGRVLAKGLLTGIYERH